MNVRLSLKVIPWVFTLSLSPSGWIVAPARFGQDEDEGRSQFGGQGKWDKYEDIMEDMGRNAYAYDGPSGVRKIDSSDTKFEGQFNVLTRFGSQ